MANFRYIFYFLLYTGQVANTYELIKSKINIINLSTISGYLFFMTWVILSLIENKLTSLT
jgi:hypothetical protein